MTQGRNCPILFPDRGTEALPIVPSHVLDANSGTREGTRTMPTNLPPDALEAERRYRAAKTPAEKLTCLEEFISLIPKHKGTDHLRADLNRRLSKLKGTTHTRKTGSQRESAYQFDREGAGQVVVVGWSNTGKSALVTAVSNVTPTVSAAPFASWEPTVGTMWVEDVQIQVVDTPSLDRGFVEPELMDLIRGADLVLLAVDLQRDPVQQLEDSVAMLAEQRIVPRHRQDRYPAAGRVTAVPLLVVANKCDDASCDENLEIFCELLEEDWPTVAVSASNGRNLERLKEAVFERLEIIRVYSKPPGEEPDLSEPFVVKKGTTVEELAGKVHKDFLERLKTARIWGSGVHDGQLVGRDHVLQDGDVVELRI